MITVHGSIGAIRAAGAAAHYRRRVVQNCAMDLDLTAIKAALTDISDVELNALIAATYGVPQTATGLLAWIDSACDWKMNRRAGSVYPLQLPEAAIPPDEDGGQHRGGDGDAGACPLDAPSRPIPHPYNCDP